MALASAHKWQVLVGLAITAVGLTMGWGAWDIPSEAGYAGIGPNFLPWVVSIALLLFGLMLIREALTGGFRQLDADDADASPFMTGFFWLSAGLLVNAALITTVGFVIGCALCFMLAAQGLRQSQWPSGQSKPGMALVAKRLCSDLVLGVAIAAPVFWMFTKLLAIKLPGLTSTGWI
jgi:putative tricarboxylic transport membrane protein